MVVDKQEVKAIPPTGVFWFIEKFLLLSLLSATVFGLTQDEWARVDVLYDDPKALGVAVQDGSPEPPAVRDYFQKIRSSPHMLKVRILRRSTPGSLKPRPDDVDRGRPQRDYPLAYRYQILRDIGRWFGGQFPRRPDDGSVDRIEYAYVVLTAFRDDSSTPDFRDQAYRTFLYEIVPELNDPDRERLVNSLEQRQGAENARIVAEPALLLLEKNEPAARRLRKLYDDRQHPEINRRALEAVFRDLRNLKRHDLGIQLAVIPFLRSESQVVREAAARILQDEKLTYLPEGERLSRRALVAVAALLNHSPRGVAMQIAEELTSPSAMPLWTNQPRLRGALQSILERFVRHSAVRARLSAALAADLFANASISTDLNKLVNRIDPLLRPEDAHLPPNASPETRALAAEILGRNKDTKVFAQRPVESDADLHAALALSTRSPHQEVRMAAVAAFDRIKPPDEVSQLALVDRIAKNRSSEEVLFAAKALGYQHTFYFEDRITSEKVKQSLIDAVGNFLDKGTGDKRAAGQMSPLEYALGLLNRNPPADLATHAKAMELYSRSFGWVKLKLRDILQLTEHFKHEMTSEEHRQWVGRVVDIASAANDDKLVEIGARGLKLGHAEPEELLSVLREGTEASQLLVTRMLANLTATNLRPFLAKAPEGAEAGSDATFSQLLREGSLSVRRMFLQAIVKKKVILRDLPETVTALSENLSVVDAEVPAGVTPVPELAKQIFRTMRASKQQQRFIPDCVRPILAEYLDRPVDPPAE